MTLYSRRDKIRKWFYNRIPMWMKKRDFEVFAAFLSFSAGLPMLLGDVEAASVESLLPVPVVKMWALILSIAPVFIFTGIVRSTQTVYPSRAQWMRVEALGLSAIGWASYMYAACILIVAAAVAWPAAMIVIAFGLTAHSRELAIQLELAEFRTGVGLDERV